MPVVLLLTALVILAGVVVVAVGRGGELTLFRSDAAPLRQRLATAADMASFRPPLAFFGYSPQATDDALQRIARAVADRDAELARLRGQLAVLRPDPATPGERGAAAGPRPGAGSAAVEPPDGGEAAADQDGEEQR
jgi:catechol 2,3-dioxygenase-like lactoylglutathione lyase family enzyme